MLETKDIFDVFSNDISYEDEIFEFVKSISNDAIRSNKTLIYPFSLSIVIPSKKLAIEFCRLYFHSEKFKDNNFHYDKWKACKEKGYRLVTIFEDEFINSKEKVFAALRSFLGIRENGKGARKLQVSKVSPKLATDFLNTYHLQGSCQKAHSYGLFDGAALVACMSFGAPSRKLSQRPEYIWELRRFVTNGKSYPGAASRLFKAFLTEHEPNAIGSFSDRRWFDGRMYDILGFEKREGLSADYSYVKGNYRYHKSAYARKGFLSKHPEIYSEELTEKEMAKLAGLLRIYDCGKDKWIWKKGT